jgi:hypothetical protein
MEDKKILARMRRLRQIKSMLNELNLRAKLTPQGILA